MSRGQQQQLWGGVSTRPLSSRRVTQLSEELLRKRQQEQEEAQHLESMVQSVEHNLRLMTVRLGFGPPAAARLLTPVHLCAPVPQRRAARAESSVSRLTAELQQLQVELPLGARSSAPLTRPQLLPAAFRPRWAPCAQRTAR